MLIVGDPTRVGELRVRFRIRWRRRTGSRRIRELRRRRHDRCVHLAPAAGRDADREPRARRRRALIETLRDMAPRAEVAIVVVGDDNGPIRTRSTRWSSRRTGSSVGHCRERRCVSRCRHGHEAVRGARRCGGPASARTMTQGNRRRVPRSAARWGDGRASRWSGRGADGGAADARTGPRSPTVAARDLGEEPHRGGSRCRRR